MILKQGLMAVLPQVLFILVGERLLGIAGLFGATAKGYHIVACGWCASNQKDN